MKTRNQSGDHSEYSPEVGWLLQWAGAADLSRLAGEFGPVGSLFPHRKRRATPSALPLRERLALPLFPNAPIAHLTALEFLFNALSNPVFLPENTFHTHPKGGLANLLSGAFDLATIYGKTAIQGDLRQQLNRCLVWPWNTSRLSLDDQAPSGRGDILRLHNVIAQDGAALSEDWFAALPPLQRALYYADGDLGLNRAIIPDLRNDQSLLTSQFHRAVISFHNCASAQWDELQDDKMDRTALLDRTRRFVTGALARVILLDILPRFVDPAAIDWSLQHRAPLYCSAAAMAGTKHILPLEACALIGTLIALHRPASLYPNQAALTSGNMLRFDDMFAQSPLSGLPNQLFLSPRVPTRLGPNCLIDWRLFCHPNKALSPAHHGELFITDNKLLNNSLTLAALANFPPAGTCLEAARNSFDQDLPVLTPSHLRQCAGRTDATADDAPLMTYVLAEARVMGKQGRLGPLGSLIVAETFVGAIQTTMPEFTATDIRSQPTALLLDFLTMTGQPRVRKE
ncbi:MAG: hypothetical protein AAFR73_11590 [Pseudomonadota bacterium]